MYELRSKEKNQQTRSFILHVCVIQLIPSIVAVCRGLQNASCIFQSSSSVDFKFSSSWHGFEAITDIVNPWLGKSLYCTFSRDTFRWLKILNWYYINMDWNYELTIFNKRQKHKRLLTMHNFVSLLHRPPSYIPNDVTNELSRTRRFFSHNNHVQMVPPVTHIRF